MSEFMQRTSNREGFENPVMVSLRTDLIRKFHDLAGKEMKNIGANYFAHNLIKNCLQEGHTTSSFYTNMDWQERYWDKYWDCDIVTDSCHTVAETNGCGITSWKIMDPNSDCAEEKRSIGNMRDGFTFWIQHYNGVFENFSFGWEKYDVKKVNREKLAKLWNMITDFRIQHYRLNNDMFEEGYPAVNFH